MGTVGSLAGTVLSVSNRLYFYQQILLLQITESNKKSTKDLIKLVENATLQLQNGELLLLKNLSRPTTLHVHTINININIIT